MSHSTLARRVAILAAVLCAAACGSGGGSGTPTPVPTSTPPAATPNGEQNKTAAQILEDARTALRGVTSVRMTGTLQQNGQNLDLDLRMNAAGDGTGTLNGAGATANLIAAGGKLYMQGKDYLVKVLNADPSKVSDGWYLDDISQSSSGLLILFNPGQLADHVITATSSATIGQPITVNNIEAVPLTDSTGTLAVATAGKPFPLELKTSDGTSVLDWTDFDSTSVSAGAPASSAPLSSLRA